MKKFILLIIVLGLLGCSFAFGWKIGRRRGVWDGYNYLLELQDDAKRCDPNDWVVDIPAE